MKINTDAVDERLNTFKQELIGKLQHYEKMDDETARIELEYSIIGFRNYLKAIRDLFCF